MACGCKRAGAKKFIWTSPPDENDQTISIAYDNEVVAKAKVMRKGGTYAQAQ